MSNERVSSRRGLIRQGDVLLAPVKALPSEVVAVRRAVGPLVLAKGEATGHAHAIREPGASLFRSIGRGNASAYLVVDDVPATLTHEEHDALTIAPGVWEVRQQREYVPSRRPGATQWGRVAD